ncbi:MAG: type IV toxin-antitoxin system AbiEi family antitoxin domain-containing protein [Gammaproteobacteria bacterium]|nr:type IV toxin-antitoxin system AbiEi family antitoxin domain-containing protein [Gammaproteobacteria bacterium]MCY4226503.1 type IV toxin-antitoxin system AbiEi family antitoxin domain-containing protein [Gammaproteobacteria bacterium]
MNVDSRSKLNRLLSAWQPGTVAVSRWLQSEGAYQQLVHGYEKSRWIRRIGHGAFVRVDDNVEWSGALHALQVQLEMPVHAGAKTALQLQGYGHYLPMGKGGMISLFASSGTRLPAWFRHYDWGVTFRYVATTLFADNPDIGLTEKKLVNCSITISAPERAIMEVLYLVPKDQSFDEALLLMEGLTLLRPHLIQSLLEQCHSIKVKRLFMVLAETCNHSWLKKLDLSKVDFGKGKRMIIKGGRLDSKYGITVPDTESGWQSVAKTV